MSLTDDPFYRNMVEGNNTPMLVGVLGVAGQDVRLPFVEVDWYQYDSDRMEAYVADIFDKAPRLNLHVKGRSYRVEVDRKSTAMVFAEGEMAVHTAPDFWAEYEAQQPEHDMFQESFRKAGVWLLLVATRKYVRQMLVGANGVVMHRKTMPMTPELMKAYRIGEEMT